MSITIPTSWSERDSTVLVDVIDNTEVFISLWIREAVATGSRRPRAFELPTAMNTQSPKMASPQITDTSTWDTLSVYYAPGSISNLLITHALDAEGGEKRTHQPLYYAVVSLRNKRPDVALHRLGRFRGNASPEPEKCRLGSLDSDILDDGDATKVSSLPEKLEPEYERTQARSRGENQKARKGGRHGFDCAEAKAAPVVGTAHFRHTRKRVGLAFGVELESLGAAGHGLNDGSGGGRVNSQHWQTMRQLDVTGGKHALSLPTAEGLKREGVDVGLRPADEKLTRKMETSRKGPQEVAKTNNRGFYNDFEWALSAASAAQVPVTKSATMAPEIAFRSLYGRESLAVSKHSRNSSDCTTERANVVRASTMPTSHISLDTHQYVWKRTHSTASGLQNAALYRRCSLANWKLVDEHSGNVVALFESNGLKSFRKRGVLRICRKEVDERQHWLPSISTSRRAGQGYEHVNDEWEVFVLGVVLTYCVLEEQLRRS